MTKGSLSADSVRLRTSKKSGRTYLKPSLPVFMERPTKKGRKTFLKVVPMMRQCTETYKIEPIRKKTREIMRQLGVPKAYQWIGISTDEAHRMKPSKHKLIENIWPLIDRGVSREACIAWVKAHGFPEPPRSACVQCPYHSDEEWLRLKRKEPEAFKRAVRYEQRLQRSVSKATALKADTVFLHRSCVSLSVVQFADHDPRADQFGNECEGICGV